MSELINLLGSLLGKLMYFCYRLLGDYGLSILLFTLITKIIMFPLSLISQKNSIIMVKMRPKLDDIMQRFSGNASLISKEQKSLYKKEGYSNLKSILPLLVQIPIILGLIQVIYHPLQHLLRLETAQIQLLLDKAVEISGRSLAAMGSGAELETIGLIQHHTQAFSGLPGIDAILAMDMRFLGTDIATIPRFNNINILYPLFSGLSALVLSLYQSKHNVLQRSQSGLSRWATTLFLVLFSAVFAYFLPSGVGLYWIAGNLLSIPVLALCNKIYSPVAYMDLLPPTKPKLSREEKQAARELKKGKRSREKADAQRFAKTKDKQLVFYSESNGFYKYFAGFIDYVLAHSEELQIDYVTSDIDDKIFMNENPRIRSYYIGPMALIQFMMLMDADIVVMTMPDLQQYHIKRSLVRKDIEYVYLDHGMSSFHMMLKEGALDHFDTIFCYGPNHLLEVRETEKVYDLPAKRLVKTGYPLLDSMLQSVAELGPVQNEPKVILVAPSWQPDNILEFCLDETLKPLLQLGYHVIVRPHPEFVKRFPEKMQSIIKRYEAELGEHFEIQTDFSSSFTVYTADLVITDWSTIAHEFSYATKKPSLFINTPMKVINPEYKKISLVPLDLSLREEIGRSLEVEQLDKLSELVEDLFSKADWYRKKISEIVEANIFDVGHGAEGGGKYILQRLAERKQATAELPEGGSAAAAMPLRPDEDFATLLTKVQQLAAQPEMNQEAWVEQMQETLVDTAGVSKTKGRWFLEAIDAMSTVDQSSSDEKKEAETHAE